MFLPIKNVITLYIKNTKGKLMMAPLGRNVYRVCKYDIVLQKKNTFYEDVLVF